MFTPNQADVRRFFCAAWRKQVQQQPMEAIETIAAQWALEHPEYHAQLADEEKALEHTGETSESNAFLHLSLHLSLTEQCSIDQPKGIRAAMEALIERHGDLHAAHHDAMECLAMMIWETQRSGRPPDVQTYLSAVQRKGTAD